MKAVAARTADRHTRWKRGASRGRRSFPQLHPKNCPTLYPIDSAHSAAAASIASRARAVVRNPKAIRIFNRTGGTLLVGAGIATVAMRSGN